MQAQLRTARETDPR